MKTIGDAVMLVSSDPPSMIDALLDLIDATGSLGENLPLVTRKALAGSSRKRTL